MHVHFGCGGADGRYYLYQRHVPLYNGRRKSGLSQNGHVYRYRRCGLRCFGDLWQDFRNVGRQTIELLELQPVKYNVAVADSFRPANLVGKPGVQQASSELCRVRLHPARLHPANAESLGERADMCQVPRQYPGCFAVLHRVRFKAAGGRRSCADGEPVRWLRSSPASWHAVLHIVRPCSR